MTLLIERARAKVNLTLQVLGREESGYHLLESLVAFAGVHDTLTINPSRPLSLTPQGVSESALGPVEDNLVFKAVRLFKERFPNAGTGAFSLHKRLPIAAGIGGGSADAAAALRLMARLNTIEIGHPFVIEAARLTGADVPVCLESKARMMQGKGDVLGPVHTLPPLPCVLVNPGVMISTAAVFQAFDSSAAQTVTQIRRDRLQAIPRDPEALLKTLMENRNDLEPIAIRLAPVIESVRDALRRTPGCRLARMSGSGATVFGLFKTCQEASAAAGSIRKKHPDWWIQATLLR